MLWKQTFTEFMLKSLSMGDDLVFYSALLESALMSLDSKFTKTPRAFKKYLTGEEEAFVNLVA